jgi:hypothetical protein
MGPSHDEPPASCPDAQALKHLEKSEVVDNDTGEGKPDSVRTSSGAFFGVAEDPVSPALSICSGMKHAQLSNSAGDPICCSDVWSLICMQVIQRIEERIARVSFLPVENGEGLQVLRYEVRCHDCVDVHAYMRLSCARQSVQSV